MRKHILLHILILSFIFISMSTAHSAEEEKHRLLVIPLKALSGVKKDEAILLSDILSIEIHRSGKFTILNRDDMKTMLNEKEFELAMGCDDNVCLLENVEKLAVDKIITGNIGKLGRKYIISIRMINKDGENEVMERESCTCEVEELDSTIEQISYKFLKYLGDDTVQDVSIRAESKPRDAKIYRDGNNIGATPDGSIRVESKPLGAKIYLDGDKIGTTPDSMRRIAPGAHKVEVRMDGYKEWSKMVDVKAGEKSVLTAKLQKQLCSLRVRSKPSSAKIYIDGRYSGTAPGTIKSIVPGNHKVEIKKEGYSVWSKSVKVEAGEENVLTAKLEKQLCSLLVRSDPSSADIYIDGSYGGTTPDTIKSIASGRHKVEVKKDGYKVWSKRVKVKAGEEASIFARLKYTVPEVKSEVKADVTESDSEWSMLPEGW